MATLSQTLQIILTASDQTAGAIGGVANEISKIADAGKSLTQPLADVTSGVLKFQTGLLAAGATMAIISANEAQKFETAFREIATLIEQPVENLDGFKQSLLDYAKSSTQSLDEIIAATYDAISAGVDYKDALDRVKDSEILAVAGKAELSDANRLLNRTLEIFGETNYTAEQAADALFTTVKEGVITIPELAGVLGKVAGIGGDVGVSLEELLAAISALSKTEEPAAAVTALLGVIKGIVQPSEQAAKEAERLGLNFSVAGLESAGFQGMLLKIIEATGGSSEKMADLFGNIRGLTGVFGLAREGGAAFNEALAAQQNATGAAREAFEKFSGVLDTGVDALRVLAITLGQPVLDSFIRAKAEITNITNALSGALAPEGPLAGLGGLIGDIYKDVADTLADIAANLPGALEQVDFSGFLQALEDLWSAIGRLLRVEDLRTEDGLAKVIQTLVDLLTQTTTFTKGAIDALGPFVAKVGEFAVAISQIDPAQIALIGELGGYALAANIGFTALASGVLIVKGALPALALATTAVSTATGALATGLSGGAGLVALLGPVGLGAAAVAAVASYTVLEVSKKRQAQITQELKDGIGPLVDEIEREAEAARETRLRIERNLLTRSQEIETTADLAAQTQRLTEYWKEQGFAYDAVTGAITRQVDAEEDLIAGQRAMLGNLQLLTAAQQEHLGIVVGVAGTYQEVGDKTVRASGHFAEVTDKTKDAAVAMEDLVASGKLTAEQLIEITKNANDFESKMEEIASNERIKTIEATVSLNVARLETDAERVKATFASIDTTIGSTGDLLGSLFGALIGTDDFFKEGKINRQIDIENKRRQEALDIQKKLAEAEIARIEAQTRNLNRGDPWIRIDGTGLEPELEAFMWRILQRIRTQVSAEFGDFLMGTT